MSCTFSVLRSRWKAVKGQLYQRSADYFLGVPFNIACYALLTAMFAQRQCDLHPRNSVWTGAMYTFTPTILERKTSAFSWTALPLPALNIKRKPNSISGYQFEDFEIVNYQSHPSIKAPIAVWTHPTYANVRGIM